MEYIVHVQLTAKCLSPRGSKYLHLRFLISRTVKSKILTQEASNIGYLDLLDLGQSIKARVLCGRTCATYLGRSSLQIVVHASEADGEKMWRPKDIRAESQLHFVLRILNLQAHQTHELRSRLLICSLVKLSGSHRIQNPDLISDLISGLRLTSLKVRHPSKSTIDPMVP